MAKRRVRKSILMPKDCPGFTGIAVQDLMESLSTNYRNPQPTPVKSRVTSSSPTWMPLILMLMRSPN